MSVEARGVESIPYDTYPLAGTGAAERNECPPFMLPTFASGSLGLGVSLASGSFGLEVSLASGLFCSRSHQVR